MSRFALVGHGRNVFVAGPNPNALKLGMNIAGQSLDATYQVDHAKAGAPAADTTGAVPPVAPTYLDAKRWPTQVPPGATFIQHNLVNPPVAGWKYQITWAGNMPTPTGWQCTIDSWDNVNKIGLVTPSSNAVAGGLSPALRYTIPDTANYPKNIVATPSISGVLMTGPVDPTVKTTVQNATTANAPLRFMKAMGVEDGGAPFEGAWGGGTQASPIYKVKLANRSTTDGAEWSVDVGVSGTNANDGLPIELIIAQANAYNRSPWICFNWNAEPALIQFYGQYVRDNLNPSLTCYIELGNEVWNFGYNVAGQADAEAKAANRTSGVDLPATGSLAYGARRYCEKLIEYFGYFMGQYNLASSQPGGAKPTICRVLAWQHGTDLTAFMNYDPAGGTDYTKNHIDAISTSPYYAADAIDDTIATSPGYDTTRGTAPVIDALYCSAERVWNIAESYQALAAANGKTYVAYEGGPMVYLGSDGNPTSLAFAKTLDESTGLANTISFMLQRGESACPGMPFSWFAMMGAPSAQYGSWGLIETIYQDVTTAPKYQAVKNYLVGNRYLTNLDGVLVAPTGASAGTIVGTVRRRLTGSTITVDAPFSVVDPTAQVLQITVGSAASFVSAGSLNCVIHETGGIPSVTNTTTLACTVTANNFWDPNNSHADHRLETSGSTIRRINQRVGEGYRFARAARARTNGYCEIILHDTGGASVGLVSASSASGPGQDAHSIQWWAAGHIVVNGSVIADVPSFTSNDNLGFAISASGKLYVRKNGGSWYGAGSNVTAGVDPVADTGGIDLSAVLSGISGLYPAISSGAAGTWATLHAHDTDFTYTKPTGYSQWV